METFRNLPDFYKTAPVFVEKQISICTSFSPSIRRLLLNSAYNGRYNGRRDKKTKKQNKTVSQTDIKPVDGKGNDTTVI